MSLPRTLNWRLAGAATLTALCLTLAACLLSPGRFTSQLDVRKDGRFSFTYSGEVYLLALSKLAEMGDKTAEFKPQPCYHIGETVADAARAADDEKSDYLKEKPCSAADLAAQKETWEVDHKASAEKSKRDAEAMKAMLGGIDPSSPKAAEDLANRLRRQEGWRRVDYKGDGLFDVDFAVSGTLDRDFSFPSIERFPMANAFVTINRRKDGTLRIDAPGFATAAGIESMRSLMLLGAASKGGTPPALPVTEGTFTLTTDASVLANNTDEGPQADTAGQRLAWTISARAAGAPTALLRLGR